MRELDESLGDLLGQHADRTVDILEEVSSNIRNLEPALLKIDEVIAELDWYDAWAVVMRWIPYTASS